MYFFFDVVVVVVVLCVCAVFVFTLLYDEHLFLLLPKIHYEYSTICHRVGYGLFKMGIFISYFWYVHFMIEYFSRTYGYMLCVCTARNGNSGNKPFLDYVS